MKITQSKDGYFQRVDVETIPLDFIIQLDLGICVIVDGFTRTETGRISHPSLINIEHAKSLNVIVVNEQEKYIVLGN